MQSVEWQHNNRQHGISEGPFQNSILEKAVGVLIKYSSGRLTTKLLRVFSNRAKGNGQKPEHREFHEEKLLYCESDGVLEQAIHRDSVLSFGEIQDPSECFPVQSAVGNLLYYGAGLNQQRSLPTSTIPWFCFSGSLSIFSPPLCGAIPINPLMLNSISTRARIPRKKNWAYLHSTETYINRQISR